jgi:hypothetical protein
MPNRSSRENNILEDGRKESSVLLCGGGTRVANKQKKSIEAEDAKVYISKTPFMGGYMVLSCKYQHKRETGSFHFGYSVVCIEVYQ